MKLSELEILIDKYLAGKAAEHEKKLVERWLDRQEDGDTELPPAKREALAACFWNNILSHINGENPSTTAPPPMSVVHHGNRKHLLKIAAALLLLVMAAAVIRFLLTGHLLTSPVYHMIAAKNGSVMHHVLPDGSKVSLFPGSSIQVPDDFNRTDRNIKASGRVFFDVVRNEKKVFHVTSGPLDTRVLGTSFEVSTLMDGRTSVVVKSGRVAVSQDGKQLSELIINKRITVDVKYQKTVVDSVNADGICNWQNGTLYFDQTPLPEVLTTLGQWYNIPVITQNNKWDHEKVTMQVEASFSAADAMRLLSETLGNHYRFTGQQIIIY